MVKIATLLKVVNFFRFGVYDKPGNVSKERKFGLRSEAIGFTRGRGAIA